MKQDVQNLGSAARQAATEHASTVRDAAGHLYEEGRERAGHLYDEGRQQARRFERNVENQVASVLCRRC